MDVCSKELKPVISQLHNVNNFSRSLLRKLTAPLSYIFKHDKVKEDISTKSCYEQKEEGQIKDIVEILVNMVFIGKEKRSLCEHYNVVNGACEYMKFDIDVPTMTTIKDGDVYKPLVSSHPEICAVCPFWHKRCS